MTIEVESTETMYTAQEKTFYLPRGKCLRMNPTGSVRVNRFSSTTILDTYTVTQARTFGAYHAEMRLRVYCLSGSVSIEIGDDLSETALVSDVHPYCHFHGYAANQTAGDSKFFDLAAGNHGIRGANLADATMFANAGFVTTANPSGGLNDTAIRIPSLNFDYLGGESCFIWWLGKATPEASDISLMGDGTSTTEGLRGIQARVKTTGKMDLIAIGAAAKYSGSTTGIPFDGALHSVAFALNGANGTHCMWVDEAVSYSGEVGFSALGAGVTVDTKTSNTFNIGQSKGAPGDTDGGVIQTRALVIVRLPSSYSMPGASTLTSVFQQLRANPGKPILASAF